MEKYVVHGGARLTGEVTISGAKNAVVAILPATLLAQDTCIIENVPNISDVTTLLQTLECLGAKVRMIDKSTVMIDTRHVMKSTVPYELARQLRASSYFLGALLGRFNQACVSMPGGCDLGVRPIDQHLKGFEALGAEISLEKGGMIDAHADMLVGSQIYLDMASVGATINIMLAGAKAKGLTVIEMRQKNRMLWIWQTF